MKKKEETKTDKGQLLGAALIGAAAATVAGLLYLGTSDTEKKTRKVRGWMFKTKGEVLEKIEKMDKVTKEKYDKAVDTVTDKYGKYDDVKKTELDALKKELKQHWKNILSEAGMATDAVKYRGKRSKKKLE